MSVAAPARGVGDLLRDWRQRRRLSQLDLAVDAENARMAWGASTVNSWYKSASGRVSQNWPFTLLEFWRRTQQPDPADYELLG